MVTKAKGEEMRYLILVVLVVALAGCAALTPNTVKKVAEETRQVAEVDLKNGPSTAQGGSNNRLVIGDKALKSIQRHELRKLGVDANVSAESVVKSTLFQVAVGLALLFAVITVISWRMTGKTIGSHSKNAIEKTKGLIQGVEDALTRASDDGTKAELYKILSKIKDGEPQ